MCNNCQGAPNMRKPPDMVEALEVQFEHLLLWSRTRRELCHRQIWVWSHPSGQTMKDSRWEESKDQGRMCLHLRERTCGRGTTANQEGIILKGTPLAVTTRVLGLRGWESIGCTEVRDQTYVKMEGNRTLATVTFTYDGTKERAVQEEYDQLAQCIREAAGEPIKEIRRMIMPADECNRDPEERESVRICSQ